MSENPFYLNSTETINIKEELAKYLRNWPWFVFTLGLFITIAFFYLKYTTVIYSTSAKIKILDEASKNIDISNDISSIFESSKVNLENEIEIIKSTNLLKGVVKDLGLQIKYFEKGTLKSKELWEPPFIVTEIDSLNPLPERGSYTVTVTDSGYDIISDKEKTWKINLHTFDTIQGDLPFLIKTQIPNIKTRHINKDYLVSFTSVQNAAMSLSSQLGVAQLGKSSDILNLSINGEHAVKSKAILNEVIRHFDLDGIRDRQLVSQRTIDFVDKRFLSLSEELDSIEKDKERFKQKNSLSDIKLDAEYTIVRKANTSDEVIHYENQLEVAQLLQDILDKENDFTLLPANIGIENEGINNLISSHNSIILRINRLEESAGVNNPIAKNLREKISNLRVNISNSVRAFQEQSKAILNNVTKVNKNTKGLFSGIPKKEKILRAIERQQTIKESLYLILLQRREEASINLAITTPSVKVVDYAITNISPVKPKGKNTFLIAIMSGIFIPFIILYLLFFMDTRIHSKDDLRKFGLIKRVIGEIPFVDENRFFTTSKDRSSLVEAFRILRTSVEHNLFNVLKLEKKCAKLIYVTSSVKGEGKTFTAINLASSYAKLNKKTLLLGADFRNPQIHNYLDIPNRNGLANYFYGQVENIEDIIFDYNQGNSQFKILLSGSIPPNPDELLSDDRFKTLIDKLKQEYDYIVVDTAPTVLVTDTLLISSLADITLYVIRSRFSDKKLLAFNKDLIDKGKLVNINYIINGLMPSRLYGYNYNYGYNYGYGAKKITWFQKLFKK